MTPSVNPPQLDFAGLPLSIQPANVSEGQPYWRIRKAVALNRPHSRGSWNVYVRCFQDNKPLSFIVVGMTYPEGSMATWTDTREKDELGDWKSRVHGEWNPDDGPGPYTLRVSEYVEGGFPSEALVGMGLPIKEHYVYVVEFELLHAEPIPERMLYDPFA